MISVFAASGAVSKMAQSGKEKAFCVMEFAKTMSVITVQRRFREKYGKEPPHRHSMTRWVHQFEETGCLCKGKSTGRPRVSDETVETIRASFLRSPQKSTNRASRELNVPQKTVWRVLRKRLHFKPYKFHMVQALKREDYPKRQEFCESMQLRLEEEGFAERLVFSDEATFHLCGNVNRHNLRFWGLENPHAVLEHVRDSPKINVFCAITNRHVFGPFFFAEKTVTGITYLDMLSEWLIPQLEETVPDFVFQQDGAPPHWHNSVRAYLNEHLPGRWIGRAGVNDLPLLLWPPRSPDLTPCDFSIWGYAKDTVFKPPLPQTLHELKERIRAAFAAITPDMLQRIWDELDYRLDVCRVTRGAHIEHL